MTCGRWKLNDSKGRSKRGMIVKVGTDHLSQVKDVFHLRQEIGHLGRFESQTLAE
jgi:hypothetical protein